jgi:anthranilate synthase component I
MRAEDQALADEMLSDEKERSEHVMLVDLGRNDVGRVSEFGSVKVDRLMFVERYSHVMHIVSSIEGRLKPKLTAVDALRACFPAGTLSGAPKVRAMEIIEELEPARRGTYGGAVLYADFLRQPRLLHRHPLHARHQWQRLRPGRRRHRRRLHPRKRSTRSLNKAKAVIRAIERARDL